MTDFERELKPYLDFVIEQTSMMAPIPEKISYNICAALIRNYHSSNRLQTKALLEAYKRKVKHLQDMEDVFDDEAAIRLEIKTEVYRTFITELQRIAKP